MLYDIINLIRFITVFQIFFMSVFLLLHSKRNSKRNLLLVLFIMSKAMFVGDVLLIAFHQHMPEFIIDITCLGTTFQFLLGPAIYYIMVVTTNSLFSFKPKHILHIIPFLLYAGLIFSQYQIQPVEIKLALLRNWFPYTAQWFEFVSFLIYLHFCIYGVLALSVLSHAKEDMFSFNSQSVERNIVYLKFIIYDFIIVWGINILTIVLPFGTTNGNILQIVTAFNIFFIANAIVYQGLRFPNLFHDKIENRSKYEKNTLSDDEKKQYTKRIRNYVLNNKPYLDPMLSLSDFSEQLALPPYVVSQILNVSFNQNFYNFINQYRIEESKQLLSDFKSDKKTILDILMQCGFNSKSVFNNAFKKHTGMTPREFKKNIVAQT
jgi:AraC-like DNA-binding protein